MNPELDRLLSALEVPRRRLLVHPLYGRVNGLEDLRVFLEHHVFAVWDFMSLLKALQRLLSCCDVPWLPRRSATAARFVNEIVLGEESDELAPGEYLSHFELYRAAMVEAGANTDAVDAFMEQVSAGQPVEVALSHAGVPQASAAFVRQTMAIATSDSPHVIASAFCLGREEIIPDMFRHLVDRLDERFPGRCTLFRRYLARHIQVDTDRHGPLALRILAELCHESPSRWQEAAVAAHSAIEARIALWDAITTTLSSSGAAEPGPATPALFSNVGG